MLAPAIASYAISKLDVWARSCGSAGTGEGVFHRSHNGSSWSPNWANLGGCLASAPGADAWAPEQLHVLERGCDLPVNVWMTSYNGSWVITNTGSWP